MKLTTANIDLPNGKNDLVIFDSELRGFGLRVRRGSGDRMLKSWIIQKRMKGRMRRMLVGDAAILSPAQARTKAKKLLAEIELGGDPQGDKVDQREADKLTFRHVVTQYLDHKVDDKDAVKPRTAWTLKNYLLGPLGRRAKREGREAYLKGLHAMPITSVTRRDISTRLLHVAKASGVSTSIALRGALSNMFGWAMMNGLVEVNPMINTSYKVAKPKARDRVLLLLDEDEKNQNKKYRELIAVWNGVEGMGEYASVIRLLILTGCRREEIGNMTWNEFASDMSMWTLPASRSKNRKKLTLPVTSLMLEIIDSVPIRDGVDHLFGKRGFTPWAVHKAQLDARLDLKPWVHHDIRRTVASGMADLGVAPHVIEEVLNHRSGGTRSAVAIIYNRSGYRKEVQAAMALWSDHIRSITEGTGRKVVAMRSAVGAQA